VGLFFSRSHISLMDKDPIYKRAHEVLQGKMDEDYIYKRVNEVLQGRIAMGAGPDIDWVGFIKLVQDVAPDLSYQDAMSIASPLWNDLKEQGIVGGRARKMKKTSGRRMSAGSTHNPLSDDESQEVLMEMLGEGFTRDEIIAAAIKVLPILAEAAQHILPLFKEDKKKKEGSGMAKRRPSSRSRSRSVGRGGSRSRSRSVGRGGSRSRSRSVGRSKSRSKSRSRSRSVGRGGAAPRTKSRSRSRGKTPTKRRPSAGVSAGVSAGARARRPASKGGKRPASRTRTPAKKRGGAALANYHKELAKYKAEHPRMTHKQAVASFRKVYKR
jgi:hypothetical protein